LAKLAERRIDDAHVSTEAGTVLGTLGYLSPERARGLPVDPRTDIWSLGVVLFEMLAGKQPFTGPRATDVLLAIAERDPSPLATHRPEVPRRLDDIVRKALAKDPQRRYASANDFLAELKTVSQQLQSTTIESGPGAEEGHVLFHADREILLTEGENIVGRDSAARVRLVSGSVSRAHAAIVVTGNSATVADLQSKNGTFVNGERIDSVRLLRHGMTLRCGTVELVYRRGHPVTESIDEE
jgi:serine/threonine protein kinase